MVNEWLDAITTLILSAPGNADAGAGPLWDDTLTRLGEDTVEHAAANRVFDNYPEADVDCADLRPFFILREDLVEWRKYDATWDMAAHGAIELAYTEQTLTTAVDHRAAVRAYRGFADELICWVAENARNASGVPIAGITQIVFPQRTARRQRDPGNPSTDYFWAAWLITIGQAM